jgi:uncharacterized membrane protein YbhN (UPF0104 family)
MMSKNKIFYLALSLAISILLVGLLLSKIQTRDLIQTLANIYWPAFFLYVGTSLCSSWLRAWRYKWLLRPEPISWGKMFLVTFIRNGFDDLLPARIGSLSYVYVLNRRLNFSFESAASTFVIAFIFDFLTLSPFLGLAILIVGLGASAISGLALLLLSLLLFIIVFFILWQVIPIFRVLLNIYQSLLRFLKVQGKTGAQHSIAKLHMTMNSLSEIRARKIYLPMFLLSLLIRLGKYISLYFLFFALLRSHGFMIKDLSFWKTILGTTGAEMTSVFPVKGLAGFGTWESAWAVAFRLMNFEPGLAIISGIGVHLITNIFEYGLGLISILILILLYFQKRRRRDSDL